MSNDYLDIDARTETNDRREKFTQTEVVHQPSAPAPPNRQPRLIDAYPDQWIAEFDSNVVAHGKYLPEVLRQVDKSGIDRTQVTARFIERTPRRLVM